MFGIEGLTGTSIRLNNTFSGTGTGTARMEPISIEPMVELARCCSALPTLSVSSFGLHNKYFQVDYLFLSIVVTFYFYFFYYQLIL